MKAHTLQAMMAVNADRITNIDIQIGFHQDQAANFKTKKETAFMIDSYIKLGRERRKMAKATEMQREMKAELLYIQRTARIARNTTKLAVYGHTFVAGINDTSVEIEDEQGRLLDHLAPKKPDSRLLQKAA